MLEINERFRSEFGSHVFPEILHVGSSCSFSSEYPIRVLVSTRLPHGCRLHDLPDEYCFFPVEQEPLGDDVAKFKATWCAVLQRCFGLGERDIAAFCESRDHVFRSGFFRHDSPCDCIPPAYVSRHVFGLGGDLDANQVGEEMLRAVREDGRRVDKFYLAEDHDFDWDRAKERVDTVIDAHGGSRNSGR